VARIVANGLKNAIDRIVALVGLLVLAPLLALIGAAIWADSPGPVFYRQRRVGLRGRPFRIYKFRTMIENAENVGLGQHCARDDERITRVGKWLRRSSLDEVPQLINVLRGEMSLVGPRPTLPSQVMRYSDRHRRRLEVKPGLTGLAQVKGRNDLSWEERIEFDISYVDHWSLALDARILLKTPRAMIDTRGIYGSGGVTQDYLGPACADQAIRLGNKAPALASRPSRAL
jgi:lipopolysaccharide/colanic/teichoic acid biosynthesis glycosyltransferase